VFISFSLLWNKFDVILQGTAQWFDITGAGAGVDSVWEQRKLEARKMLAVGAAESQPSGAPKKIAHDHFIRENEKEGTKRRCICPSWTKPYLEKEARWNWQKQPRYQNPPIKNRSEVYFT